MNVCAKWCCSIGSRTRVGPSRPRISLSLICFSNLRNTATRRQKTARITQLAPAIVVFALPTDDQMSIDRRSAEDFASGPEMVRLPEGLRFGRIKPINFGL